MLRFVFDLDGTICFKGKPISNKILYSLEEVGKKGEIVFASARPIRDMLPVIDETFHHYTMIGGNGSLISKNRKVIHATTFSKEQINEIKNLIKQSHVSYLIDGEWDYAYTGPDTHPILQNLDPAKLAKKVSLDSLDSIVKVLFFTSDNIDELTEKLQKLDVYVNRHRNENVLDVSPSGINKWTALKRLGIKENTYIAFGNDANDVPMFENALHTVMIGYHEHLVSFSKEMISLNGEYEQAIAEKILELSEKYSSIQV